MGPVKTGLLVTGAVISIIVVGSLVSIVTSPLRTVSGVIERTMNPDNVLSTYEAFHDRWKGYEARLGQIAETRADLANETNAGEKARLRVDLGAQRQSCREIAAAYNANAIKTNRSIFLGREAPASLNMEAC